MENQPFRKQLIYNWNEALFLNMAFFCQFSDRADFPNWLFCSTFNSLEYVYQIQTRMYILKPTYYLKLLNLAMTIFTLIITGVQQTINETCESSICFDTTCKQTFLYATLIQLGAI